MKRAILSAGLALSGLASLVSGNNAYAQENNIEKGVVDGITYSLEEPEKGLLVLKVVDDKDVEQRIEMYGTRENLEYTGEHSFNEPDYVKSHFFFIPIKEEDFDLHVEKQNKELDNMVRSLNYTGQKYFGPKAEEQIVLTNGSRLDVVNAKGEAFYIFNVAGEELIAGKTQTDKNSENLKGDYKILQGLTRLTDEQLKRLYKIRSKKD